MKIKYHIVLISLLLLSSCNFLNDKHPKIIEVQLSSIKYNKHLSFHSKSKNHLSLKVINKDPILFIEETNVISNKLYLIAINIDVPLFSRLRVFYPQINGPKYRGKNHSIHSVNKGNNQINIIVEGKDLIRTLRVDPVEDIDGIITINAIKLHQLSIEN